MGWFAGRGVNPLAGLAAMPLMRWGFFILLCYLIMLFLINLDLQTVDF